MTCVVEIFTTAGCTLVTMEAKALDNCTGSGIASGVASEPTAGCDAPTWTEIMVPINIPMANVMVTNRVATILRFRAQAANSRSCMPILFTPPYRRLHGLTENQLRLYHRIALAHVFHVQR